MSKLPTAKPTWSQMDYEVMATKPNNGINRPLYHMEYIKKHGNIKPKERADTKEEV